MQLAYGALLQQSSLDYMYSGNWGDLPLIDGFYPNVSGTSDNGPCANSSNTPALITYADHAALGTAYYNRINAILNMTFTTNGSHPWVGLGLWTYTDKPGADGCGMTTALDGGYISVPRNEVSTSTVVCDPPLDGSVSGIPSYNCGPEVGTYTDMIKETHGVSDGNTLWLAIPNGLVPGRQSRHKL
jgi:hypothetical protein